MSDYHPPVCVGKCLHCEKDIHTFDDPNYGWLNEAAFVEMSGNSCRIVGGYGSTTMDMSSAEFTDYELFTKCLSKMRKKPNKSLYICDDCIKALLEEGRIAFSSEFRVSPIAMLTKDEHPKGYVMCGSIHPDLRRRDIFVPIYKEVFAFKYDDGPERIVEEMRKYETFLEEGSPWTIDFLPEEECVYIENRRDNYLLEVRSGEVLVVHDRGDNFDVLPERVFWTRYRYAF